MAILELEGAAYSAKAGETVLDALLRHGVDVPYSCRKGVCQSCLLRSEDVAPPERAQGGLREILRERGFFLACQCEVRRDMRIARGRDAQHLGAALVVSKELLAPQICRVRLQPAQPFDYRAGQFVNLQRHDGIVRSYSLASVPGIEQGLEIHVKRHPGGTMSGWILDSLVPGTEVDLLGPLGECVYRPGLPQQPILMIGTGTGLAPLIGVARDALDSGHRGEIHLYHGDTDLQGLYGRGRLREMAFAHRNFRFHGCISGAGALEGFTRGRASDIAFGDHPDLTGRRVYLCGSPSMVHEARKTAYLLGARLADIHADPFELRDLRQQRRSRSQARRRVTNGV